MGVSRTIGWLLLAYWTIWGIAYFLHFEGVSAKGFGGLVAYTGLGIACYLAITKITKIGTLFSSRTRKARNSRQMTRRWS